MHKIAGLAGALIGAITILLVLPSISGTPLVVAPAGSTPTYGVSFHESGLSGQTWSVTIGSVTESTNAQGGWIVFDEPNGTYSFTVTAPAGFNATPATGTVSVAGHNPAYVSVAFYAGPPPTTQATYSVSFQESGLTGQTWSVTLGSKTDSTNSGGGWISFQEPNGTYSFSVTAPAGFSSSPSSGSVTVAGRSPHYTPVKFSTGSQYAVVFNESGLSGQNWSVTVTSADGMRTTSTSSGVSNVFREPNGTYNYTVAPPALFVASPATGSVTVAGTNATNVSIEFSVGQSAPPPIQHVVVIMMENNELNTTLSFAPYLHYLWNKYGQATEFYPVCHESPPDYTAVTSGRYFVCGGGWLPYTSDGNLADVLQSNGDNWGGYFESMPTPCDKVSNSTYDTAHNPFLHYADIAGNASRCDAHVLNSAAFNQSVAAGTLPAFAFYAPNTLDDCEVSKLPVCDAWLKGFLSPLLNSTSPPVEGLMAHTAFFILFDEGTTDAGYSVGGIANSYCQNVTRQALSVCGGHVLLTAVSPYSHGTVYALNATDYSLESTIEWLLGVGSDGGYDGTLSFPPMASLFEMP